MLAWLSSRSTGSARNTRAGFAEVESECHSLFDQQVLDELAAEQLLEEPSTQPVLDLERRSLAQQFDGHQQGAVLERGALNLAGGEIESRHQPGEDLVIDGRRAQRRCTRPGSAR